MTIEEIIQLTNNRLQNLQTNRDSAFARGDIDLVVNFDNAISVTQDTLALLKTLI